MKLIVDEAGPVDAPAVLLLHGLSGNRRTYEEIMPRLAEKYRVIRADLRGHGESGHADSYRFNGYTADVAELVEERTDGPVMAVGHSLGGVISSQLAIHYPHLVRAIFLEDPPLFEGDPEVRATSPAASFFEMYVAMIRRWQADGIDEESLAVTLGATPLPTGGTRSDRSTPDLLRLSARGLLRLDPRTIDSAINGETWIDLDVTVPVECPVTVLRADPGYGAVFTAENETTYRSIVTHADVYMAQGCGHGIHEDPIGREPYLEHLEAFLDKHARP